MNKNLLMVLVIAAVVLVGYLVLSGRPQSPDLSPDYAAMEVVDETSDTNQLTVAINEQNDSGETGTATLVEENGQVVVTLSMQGYPEDTPQPAHIHTGVCPDVGGVEYPLTNVVNGESVTTLDVTLAQLESELPLGINVHKSVPEASVYTACGDLLF